MSAAGLGPSGSGSRLVEPVAENGLGMGRCPAVREHLVQPRIVRMQAEEKFAYIRPWFEAMAFRTSQDRG